MNNRNILYIMIEDVVDRYNPVIAMIIDRTETNFCNLNYYAVEEFHRNSGSTLQNGTESVHWR